MRASVSPPGTPEWSGGRAPHACPRRGAGSAECPARLPPSHALVAGQSPDPSRGAAASRQALADGRLPAGVAQSRVDGWPRPVDAPHHGAGRDPRGPKAGAEAPSAPRLAGPRPGAGVGDARRPMGPLTTHPLAADAAIAHPAPLAAAMPCGRGMGAVSAERREARSDVVRDGPEGRPRVRVQDTSPCVPNTREFSAHQIF